ncbi:AraC family transcriptional regulator [Nocardioides marmoriginsengisoli]|uniref:AraC family transcriptional regulator n=1 Tax=Nocardioides marmoriginsengisoli TaxID=661483 RepID=A0A3N0CCT4_9ACTN|nr:AraC family transcriptional regulator [Nocardioides marmoriginsengisoli]RNL61264.1 AraC family transcriptional regulator [Nocardioides marmoriginsengisoli]
MAELTIPVPFLRAALRSVAATGVDVEAALRHAGIPSALLRDNRARLAPKQVAKLIRRLWRLSGDDMLGMGSAVSPRGTLQLLAHALVGPGDVRDLLTRMIALQGAIAGAPQVSLTEGPELARVEVDASRLNDPDHLALDFSLVVMQRFTSWLIGQPLRFHQVELPYPAPAIAREYEVMFGCPVTFGGPVAAITFCSTMLDAPAIRTIAELEEYLRRSPEDLLSQREYGSLPSSRVRAALESGLYRNQWPDAEEVAATLSVSSGHLRRMLRNEGTSLGLIKEELLRDSAITAMARGASIEEVAHQLGFSEASAFRRAFKRWTGSTPTAYRIGGP